MTASDNAFSFSGSTPKKNKNAVRIVFTSGGSSSVLSTEGRGAQPVQNRSTGKAEDTKRAHAHMRSALNPFDRFSETLKIGPLSKVLDARQPVLRRDTTPSITLFQPEKAQATSDVAGPQNRTTRSV
jgi:hypothetical protein